MAVFFHSSFAFIDSAGLQKNEERPDEHGKIEKQFCKRCLIGLTPPIFECMYECFSGCLMAIAIANNWMEEKKLFHYIQFALKVNFEQIN